MSATSNPYDGMTTREAAALYDGYIKESRSELEKGMITASEFTDGYQYQRSLIRERDVPIDREREENLAAGSGGITKGMLPKQETTTGTSTTEDLAKAAEDAKQAIEAFAKALDAFRDQSLKFEQMQAAADYTRSVMQSISPDTKVYQSTTWLKPRNAFDLDDAREAMNRDPKEQPGWVPLSDNMKFVRDFVDGKEN